MMMMIVVIIQTLAGSRLHTTLTSSRGLARELGHRELVRAAAGCNAGGCNDDDDDDDDDAGGANQFQRPN